MPDVPALALTLGQEARLLPRAADGLNGLAVPDELLDATFQFVASRKGITAPPAKIWTERINRVEATTPTRTEFSGE